MWVLLPRPDSTQSTLIKLEVLVVPRHLDSTSFFDVSLTGQVVRSRRPNHIQEIFFSKPAPFLGYTSSATVDLIVQVLLLIRKIVSHPPQSTHCIVQVQPKHLVNSTFYRFKLVICALVLRLDFIELIRLYSIVHE